MLNGGGRGLELDFYQKVPKQEVDKFDLHIEWSVILTFIEILLNKG